MGGKALSPAAIAGIIVGVLAVVVLGYVLMTNQPTKQTDLKTLTPEQLVDKDPPKPGQPGYRERIDDPPAK